MALRISSAEIVSSAMAWCPLPCWVVSVWGPGSADEPSAGGLETVGDAAVDDLVTDADDQATEHARVDGHLQADRAVVEAAEELGEAALLRVGQRHGGRHVRHRLAATGRGRLGEALDDVLGVADGPPGEVVAQQHRGDRADPAGEQPVEQRGLAGGRSGAVAEDPGQFRISADDAPEAEQLVLDAVELTAGVRGVQRGVRGQGLGRLHQVQRPRPALPGRGLDQVERGLGDPAGQQPPRDAGPVRRAARRVRQRPAQRDLPVEQARDGEQLVGQGRELLGGRGPLLAGQPITCPLQQTGGRPGDLTQPVPDDRERPAAGGIHQRSPCAYTELPVAPPRPSGEAPAAMPSSWSRNRSTVPLRRAWSSRDSPTTRPARSTASAPISPRSWLTTCCREAASCSSPRAMIRADSSCAWARSSSRICWPSARAWSRICAASVRASASWARYRSSAAWASACIVSARSMPPSIASRRARKTCSNRGQTNLAMTKKAIAKVIVPMMISPTGGSSGLADSAATMLMLCTSLRQRSPDGTQVS